jgi:hypothetical protein
MIKKFGREEAAAVVGLQIVAIQKIMDTKAKEYNKLCEAGFRAHKIARLLSNRLI